MTPLLTPPVLVAAFVAYALTVAVVWALLYAYAEGQEL